MGIPDFRIDFLADFLSTSCKVPRLPGSSKRPSAESRRAGIRKMRSIHIVLNSIGRDDDIADVEFHSAGSRDSGVDDTVHAVIIHKNLRADTGIYFTGSVCAQLNHFFRSGNSRLNPWMLSVRKLLNIRHHFNARNATSTSIAPIIQLTSCL